MSRSIEAGSQKERRGLTLEDWLTNLGSRPTLPPKPFRNQNALDRLLGESMGAIRSDWRRARHLASHARTLARHLSSPSALGQADRMMGHVFLLSGRAKDAVKFYRSAWDHFSQNAIEQANTAVAMIQALAYIGEYDESLEIATKARETYEAAGDTFRAARVKANHANTLHRLDRLEEARDLYEQALPVLTENQAQADLAIVMRNYGVCLMGAQDFEGAARMYQNARTTFEEARNDLLVLEIDLNHAYLLGRQGLLREALVAYRELRATLPEDSGFEIGHCLLDQADFMAEYGLWTDAILAASDSATIFQRLGAKFELGKARLIHAIALMGQNKAAAAKPLLNEAKRILAKQPNENWRAFLSVILAAYHREKGDLKRAQVFASEAVALKSTPEREKLILNCAVDLSLDLGDLDQAEALLDRHAEPHLRARLLALRGEDHAATEAANEAVARYDQDRVSLRTSGLRRSWAAVQEQRLRTCYRITRDPLDRLKIASRLKDQTLAEAVKAPRLRNLSEQLISARSEKESAGLERSEIEKDLLALRRSAETLMEEFGARPIQIPMMPEGSRFVELFIDSGEVVAFLIEPDEIREVRLGRLEEIEGLAQYFHLHRQRFSSSGQRLTEKALDQLGNFLSPALLPIPKHLIVGRVGPLAGLPIHAAIVNGHHLIDITEISYSPSSTVYSALQGRQVSTNREVLLAGVGDEVAPEIETELAHLSEHWSVTVRRTADDIREHAPQARLIHLAAHGIRREDQPLFSSLKLGDEDLSVFDVLDLDLNADVAVLSGCSTGVSTLGESLDLQGFIEAFLVAGSNAVVASLWDVEDEPTKNWMFSFHELLRTTTPAQAFSKASKQLREKWEHPGHWAAFGFFGISHKSCIKRAGECP